MNAPKCLFSLSIAGLCVLAAPTAAEAQTRITDAATNGGVDRDSYDPKTNADGSRVAFRSDADLLSEGRGNGYEEIWLWDEGAGFTRITDALTNGANFRDSYLPSISDSGSRVAFRSSADLLSEGRGSDMEIWMWDESAGFTRLTDTLANGGIDRDSFEAAISPNGNRVAFRSDADLLSEGRAFGDEEVWLWDESAGLTRITDALANGGIGRGSFEPSLSADGSRIAFRSDADMLGEGRAEFDEEIWLWDESTGLQRLTDMTTNSATYRDAFDPEISADGAMITFESDGDLLSQGLPDNHSEIWVLDTTTSNLGRVTYSGTSGHDCWDPDISADGTAVFFESDSDFLSQGIPYDQEEIWLFTNPVPVELISFSVE